jgi:hypothetical protein
MVREASMASIPFPMGDTRPLQDGLNFLATALMHENDRQDALKRDAATQAMNTSMLRVRKRLNDKQIELENSPDIASPTFDMAQSMRDFGMEFAQEEAANFPEGIDPGQFINTVGNHVEDNVLTWKNRQNKAIQGKMRYDTDALVETAVATADSGDLKTAFDTTRTAFLTGEPSIHPETGLPTAYLNNAAIRGFGSPEAAGQAHGQSNNKVAETWINRQVSTIQDDKTKSWGEKVAYLDDLKRSYFKQIQDAGGSVTVAQRGQLDDALDKVLAGAQKAAYTEAEDNELGAIAQVSLQLQGAHSAAKIQGASFNPNDRPEIANLKGAVKTLKGQQTLASTISSLTQEADKNVSKENVDKMLAQNLSEMKGTVQAMYLKGATEGEVQKFLKDSAVPGADGSPPRLDIRNWDEAVKYTKETVKLTNDPQIKGALSALDTAKIPQAEKDILAAELVSQFGGLNRGSSMEQWKDDKGKWKTKEMTDYATKVAKEWKDKTLDKIVNGQLGGSGNKYEDSELATFASKAKKGDFAGQITSANKGTGTHGAIVDAYFSALLSKYKTLSIKDLAGPPQIDLYSSTGLPTFTFKNGAKYTPSVGSDGKLTFDEVLPKGAKPN